MLEEKRGKKQEYLHKVLLELASPSVGMLEGNSKLRRTTRRTIMSDSKSAASLSDSERYLALRRAAKASFIGNFIEWFDYASYGYLVTVIGHAFFPAADKSIQLLSTYAVFAMSFILRPIEAIVWGAWGDH